MALPEPEPGLILCYAYLWRHEHGQGRREGIKDRPCAVVAVTERGDSDLEVWVVPITHIEPLDRATAIEIPPRVNEHLGLDPKRSWIVIDEFNVFVWPGPDLRPIPGSRDVFRFGYLPPRLFEQIRRKLIKLHRQRRLGRVART